MRYVSCNGSCASSRTYNSDIPWLRKVKNTAAAEADAERCALKVSSDWLQLPAGIQHMSQMIHISVPGSRYCSPTSPRGSDAMADLISTSTLSHIRLSPPLGPACHLQSTAVPLAKRCICMQRAVTAFSPSSLRCQQAQTCPGWSGTSPCHLQPPLLTAPYFPRCTQTPA